MPDQAIDDGRGVLTIVRNAHRDDAGTYVCTGPNYYDIDRDTATLQVGSKSWNYCRYSHCHTAMQVGNKASSC